MRMLSAGDIFTHYRQAGWYIGLPKVLEDQNPGVPSCAVQSVARLTAFCVGRGHNLRCGEWHCAASIPVGQTRLTATSYLPGLFGNIGCHSDAFLAEDTVKRRLQLNLARTAEKYNMRPQDGTLRPPGQVFPTWFPFHVPQIEWETERNRRSLSLRERKQVPLSVP